MSQDSEDSAKQEAASVTNKPKRAELRSKWSDVENDAIHDPRMQEFSDPQQFADAMVQRTGVIRTMGGYQNKLWEMRQHGIDVNATLYRNVKNAAASLREGHSVKTGDAKTNGAKTNGHKANGAKPNGAKPNGFSGSKGASKSSRGSREWVSAATMAWLLGVSTKRIHQLSSESLDGRIGRRLMNPGSAQPAYTYSVGDAIVYLRSDARLQSRFATISETKEILGFASDVHTKKVVSAFTDPDDHSRIRRADVLFLWMNSPRSPATESDAKKIIAGAAIDAVTKKKMTNVKPVRAKPMTAKVAKPVKKVQPRVTHPVSAIMTPEQVAPLSERAVPDQSDSDFRWMVDGVRRGFVKKEDVAEWVEKLAGKK